MWLADNWKEYEVIDCSEGEKLERWGKYTLLRPDPQVIWNTKKEDKHWKHLNAHYHRSKKGGGEWEFFDLPKQWDIHYRSLTFHLKPFSFKHTGLFPEQAVNWDWFSDKIKKAGRPVKVLNLFAYTGGATLAAAAAGASVTHVDASKGMVTWAKEKGYLGYFMKRPKATLTDIKYGSTKQYGTPATKTVIEQHTNLTAAFVEDYCHTIWFEEMLEQLTGYNDENKGKFDIIAAMGMTELADQELSGRQPSFVRKEVEQFRDFGYYYDEKGIKRFGIIPDRKPPEFDIQREEYNDPYRIETSDTRVYERLIQDGVYRGIRN